MSFRRIAIGSTVALVATTLILDVFSHVEVLWQTTWLFWIVAIAFGILRFRYVKQEEWNIVTALDGASALIVFTSVFGIATYLLPEHAGAMWDTELVAVDTFFGLQARDVIEWTRQWPDLEWVLAKIYHSLYLHLALIVIYSAGIRRDNTRAWRFLTEMFVAAWLGLVIYAFLPAYNAIEFYKLADTHHTLGIVADLKSLRAGTLQNLHFNRVLGLVQFPSFHIAVQIVLFADIARNEKRWVTIGFSMWTMLMTWATVVVGAHYIVDLIGGAIIAGIGIAIGWALNRHCGDS